MRNEHHLDIPASQELNGVSIFVKKEEDHMVIPKVNLLRSFFTVVSLAALIISPIACGGGGGGSSAVTTYDGNTDPAVVDSTTATPLAQSGLRSASAGFPVVQVFFMEEPGAAPAAAPLAAQPLALGPGTTVLMPIPSDVVIYGADLGGGGTLTLAGTVSLWVEDLSAGGMTWTVTDATMNGSVTFDEYYNGSDGPEITGTVTVTDTTVIFSNSPVEYSMVTQDFLGDPGFPMFTDVAITFSSLNVGTGVDSYSLGEGDMEFTLDSSFVDLVIISLTAEDDDESYKIEDGQVYVSFGPSGEDITIDGYVGDYATVYHSTLGKFYFYADFTEEDPPGDITTGYFEVSEDGVSADAQFYVDYTLIDGTYYNAYMDLGSGWEMIEKGYLLDWEFIPDPSAPTLPPT